MAAAVLSLLAGCGPGSVARSAVLAPTSTTSTVAAPTSAGATTERALPRWVATATFQGTGDLRSDPFGIVPDALQWRVRWHCSTGRLRITTEPPPSDGKPLVDTACPGGGDAYAVQTGQIRLLVSASGSWTASVEQQIDTPLEEPPLPEMQSPQARVVGTGTFHAVDRPAKGHLTIYAVPGARLEMRFTGFEVPINTDLYVWISPRGGLTTTPVIASAPHVVVAALKSTSGAQNYILPAGSTIDQIRTVVIWCEVQAFAYAAADVTPTGP